MNWQNSTCSVGISIGKEWHGKGYGTDAMKTLIDFIFQYIAVQKIKLQVLALIQRLFAPMKNVASQKGILRQEIFRFGTFHDVVLFGLLRPIGRGINRIAQERYYDCCSISFLFSPLATRVLLPVRIALEMLIDRYLAYLTFAKMHNRTGHQILHHQYHDIAMCTDNDRLLWMREKDVSQTWNSASHCLLIGLPTCPCKACPATPVELRMKILQLALRKLSFF